MSICFTWFPVGDGDHRITNQIIMFSCLFGQSRREGLFFCFIVSTAQGDKHTQQLVECQRALVRAFEGRISGNSNCGCWASLGGDGLDGYASYAAMPKREREREELPGFCLLELSGAEFQKELKDRAMARARARA